jgi:hypothetical protein
VLIVRVSAKRLEQKRNITERIADKVRMEFIPESSLNLEALT